LTTYGQPSVSGRRIATHTPRPAAQPREHANLSPGSPRRASAASTC